MESPLRRTKQASLHMVFKIRECFILLSLLYHLAHYPLLNSPPCSSTFYPHLNQNLNHLLYWNQLPFHELELFDHHFQSFGWISIGFYLKSYFIAPLNNAFDLNPDPQYSENQSYLCHPHSYDFHIHHMHLVNYNSINSFHLVEQIKICLFFWLFQSVHSFYFSSTLPYHNLHFQSLFFYHSAAINTDFQLVRVYLQGFW